MYSVVDDGNSSIRHCSLHTMPASSKKYNSEAHFTSNDVLNEDTALPKTRCASSISNPNSQRPGSAHFDMRMLQRVAVDSSLFLFYLIPRRKKTETDRYSQLLYQGKKSSVPWTIFYHLLFICPPRLDAFSTSNMSGSETLHTFHSFVPTQVTTSGSYLACCFSCSAFSSPT